MKFSATPLTQAEEKVAATLRRLLETHSNVIWFVSGGSCILPQVAILHMLDDGSISRLTVLLIDERFGPSGHSESNFKKLLIAGFTHPRLRFKDILEGASTLETAHQQYTQMLTASLSGADSVIATLGIGRDGHVAGILPNSQASVDAISPTVVYNGSDYYRITAGFATLLQIDEAFVFSYGQEKQVILKQLEEQRLPETQMPSAILYDIPSVTIYNDTIESEGTL